LILTIADSYDEKAAATKAIEQTHHRFLNDEFDTPIVNVIRTHPLVMIDGAIQENPHRTARQVLAGIALPNAAPYPLTG
jgi:hypothetical protein